MYLILRTVTRRIGGVVAECNYAQQRLAELRADPERYVIEPDQAASTYQQFLLRTSRTLAHEPSAAERSAGAAVC